MESPPEDTPKLEVAPEVDHLGRLPPALVGQLVGQVVDVVRRLHKEGVQSLVIHNIVFNITMNEDKSTKVEGGLHAPGGAIALSTGDNSPATATANGAGATSPLKTELDHLTDLVDKLVKQLDPDAAEKARYSLKIFKEQAAKQKPDTQWYNLSADGLKEAAKTVASIGPDVIKSVTTVLKLLTGTGA